MYKDTFRSTNQPSVTAATEQTQKKKEQEVVQQRSSRSEVNVQTIKSVREEETCGVKTVLKTEDQSCESLLETRTMTSSPNTNRIFIQEVND